MNGQKDTAIDEQGLNGSVLADIQETELL
ncbi:hypothetical protein AGR4A_Cc170192 [Agrobacterium tumefaciens str. B6]|uniref:Uncharacterized protein n=2 Tax=Agrobacterium tumefaciens TaxID=358 RepID=A0A822UXR6_AGRTU|nr:hypothetical protein AGR4C_Cc100017 [Agrobacterium tumefaciens str. Kerr 14]CUX18571.1 hypothetical protein AGR4B_Cc60526 [Agrobacterium tumefaciens str. CFBP 5621]CVI15004.1 hypothetical protein AGR4A_Cc170192 [Agrobacterium tumefaciens str. B6]